jgi:ABC-type nitrate/sulfonate/bicarbonate transport system substrate-binding protein
MPNLTLIHFLKKLQLPRGRKWLFTEKHQRGRLLRFCLVSVFFGLTFWLEHSPPLLATHEIVASENLHLHLTPVRLQLKWKHQFQFAGYYAAKAKGYYRDAGLDVSFLEAPDTIEPAQQVLQGKAEFGVSNSDLVLLRGRGNPVVALAAIYQHSPLILLALEKSGINNVHQLAGKRVMLEAHSQE